MLFRSALLEGGAEERFSAGFGRRQPAAASLSAAGPVPESGASSQKWPAAGRQNAAFGQIVGAGAFEAAGRPCPTGCGTARPSGQPGRTAPRDSREGAQSGQKLLPGQELPISIYAPREGSDGRRGIADQPRPVFLSTLPGRGATTRMLRRKMWEVEFLSTLPGRGATVGHHLDGGVILISIHTPRKGSDDKIQQTSKMDFAQKSQIKT